MAKRILFLVVFQVAIVSLGFGQKIDLNSKLSKRQMYKDFDEFVQIVDSNTQSLVRKIATGYDAADEIRQRRGEIKKINSHGKFIYFLNDCLALTMAQHAQMAENCRFGYGRNYIDTQIVKPLYDAYIDYLPNLPRVVNLMTGFYYKGGYYASMKQVFINMDTQDTTILTNFRVLKHNDEPVGKLKNNLIKDRATWYRWDYELQQYYPVYGAHYIPRTDKIVAEDYPSKKIIELDMKNCRRILCDALPDSVINTLPKNEESDKMKITYYDSLHLLYIYMGSMTEDDGVFADSIKKIGKGKQIDKIIWDVRGNGGGSDAAWRDVLCAIIKEPLYVKGWISFRNTEKIRRIVKDNMESNVEDAIKSSIKNYIENSMGENPLPQEFLKHKIPFLDSAEFLTMVDGIENGDTVKYVPDTNSLRYEGKIYILQNKFVYSSTGTLLANAQLYPQLVTVGEPTGLIRGRGISPFIFQLPESKYTFLLDACVDLTNCETAIDVFHDRPKIEIYPTLEEMIEMNNYGNYLNKRGDEFLFKHDYLFKKVLEME